MASVPRKPSSPISKILAYDADLTKRFVGFLMQYPSLKSLQVHCKFLEISCHGVVWLATWLAFIWIIDNKEMYQMQLNMLVGLLLDIFIIAISKAFFRRRRPAVSNDAFTIGPDKFSFPSGHASRAVFILMFFITLHPLSWIWWGPLCAWATCVSLSRLLMQRHYILDVSAGVIVGILEALFIKLIWVSEETATNIITFVSYDNVPGGSE